MVGGGFGVGGFGVLGFICECYLVVGVFSFG